MKSRIQLSAGTKIEWENVNPILKIREFVVESDTMKAKMGDGVTNYKNLPYANLSLKRIDVDSVHMLDINNVLDVTGETETTYTYQDFYDRKLHRYCPHIDNYYGNFLFDINYRDINENLIMHNGLMFTDGDDFFTWTKTNIPKFIPKQYIGIRYFHAPKNSSLVQSNDPADYIWSEYLDANTNPIDLNTTIDINGDDKGGEQFFYCRFYDSVYNTSNQPLDNTYKKLNYYIATPDRQDAFDERGFVITLNKSRGVSVITEYNSDLLDKNNDPIVYASCLEIMFSNSPTGENMTKNFGIKNINTSIYYYEDQSKQGISRLTGKNSAYSKLKGKNKYQEKISFTGGVMIPGLLDYFNINNGFVSDGPFADVEQLNFWINTDYNNMYKLLPNSNSFSIPIDSKTNMRLGYDYGSGTIFDGDKLINVLGYSPNFLVSDFCFKTNNVLTDISGFKADFKESIQQNLSHIIIYKLQHVDNSDLHSFYVKPFGVNTFAVDINNSTGLSVVGLFGESIKQNKQPMYQKIENIYSSNNKVNFNINNISGLLIRNGKITSDTEVLIMLNYGNGIFSKKAGSIIIDEKLTKKVLIK